jgi:protocatechuate 3,4-dioxygenase, beta subunit
MSEINLNRRKALKLSLFAASAGVASTGIAAAICGDKTPIQPEGPFYPIQDQEDKDNDLVKVVGRAQSPKGDVIVVAGKVTDVDCAPVAGALVEIWQACASGKYNHKNDPNEAELDPNFQYWGQAVTDKDGVYSFRTIIPGAYPAGDGWVRPPHIHFKVAKRGYLELITQMYFAGNELNDQDLILKRVKAQDRSKVVIQLKKADPHPIAVFDITLEKP